jgi:hypothetical protein
MLTKEMAFEKAKLSVQQIANEGGYLFPEQAQTFLHLAVPETALLGRAPLIPMRAQERHIEKFRFAYRILRAGSAETALTDTEKGTPQFSKQVLSARTYKAQVDVPLEVLEDNIEGPGLMQSILRAMAPRIGLDWEESGINGDTDNAVDPFLALIDGLLKQASVIEYDHQGDSANLDLWNRMIKLMPVEFQRYMSGMEFYTAYNVQHDWRVNVAGRNSAMGDAALSGSGPIGGLGRPIIPVANMRDDYAYGGASAHSKVLLTHPQNVVIGLHAGFHLFWDFDIENTVWKIVLRFRSDWKLVEKTAAVLGTNVLTGPSNSNVGGTSTAILVADVGTPQSELGFTITDLSIGNDDDLSDFGPPTQLGITAPSFYPP